MLVLSLCVGWCLVLLLVTRISSNLGSGTNCDEMGQTGGVTGVSSKVVGATWYLFTGATKQPDSLGRETPGP